ncbi:hypothetical protein [Lacicoccus qingdaonensis]|uniref:Uncharacterized protein n=1 Tax=Lacicoccus qingdaonensis TaxID=576118 RepID=A0A1G9FPJ1_9BACL|nr:hypothetical protein SAMN05216216_11340 [Salinicoccus qingdaonensis]
MDLIISWGVLPLVSIFIEPAKVLFLNNAINHDQLYENNLKHDTLAKLVSYALQFDNLDDPEQIRMTEMIKDQGIAEFIKEHTELPEPLVRDIIER